MGAAKKHQARRAAPVTAIAAPHEEEFKDRHDRQTKELAAMLTLDDASQNERARLAICQKLLRVGLEPNTGSCYTPFETFVAEIIDEARFALAHGHGVDPEDIEEHWDRFKSDYADMLKFAPRFCKAYCKEPAA